MLSSNHHLKKAKSHSSDAEVCMASQNHW